MAIKCFVDVLKDSSEVEIERPYRPYRIPGTDKIRTFAASVPGLYSKESDLETIIEREKRARSGEEQPKIFTFTRK